MCINAARMLSSLVNTKLHESI